MVVDTRIVRSLYARPELRRFVRKQSTSLDEYLGTLEQNTTVDLVTGPADLLLTADGVTQSKGYRYTATGFGQVAQLLAPGLSKLLPDIAGYIRRPESQPEHFDLSLAINLFNAVVNLRFSTLKTKSVIYDDHARSIEGITGVGRSLIENRAVLRQATEATHQSPIPVEFFAAEVVGRRLTLWYRSLRPVFSVTVAKQRYDFWAGFYFCNGEASGVSLRGALALFSRFGCCLEPFRDGSRLKHIGKNFHRRVDRLFLRLVDRELRLDTLQQSLQKLVAKPLGVEGTEEERGQREKQLVDTLFRRGIAQNIGWDLVRNALFVGRDLVALPQHLMLSPATQAARTGYDLFCAMMRQSRKLDLLRRERIEQAAYDLLVGKIKI